MSAEVQWKCQCAVHAGECEKRGRRLAVASYKQKGAEYEQTEKILNSEVREQVEKPREPSKETEQGC
jgi:hypothetical protein